MSRHLVLLPAPEAAWAAAAPRGAREGDALARAVPPRPRRRRAPHRRRRAAHAVRARPSRCAPTGPGARSSPTGPFTESVEQVVGFYLVDTSDRADLVRVCTEFAAPGRAHRVPRHGRRRPGRPVVTRYVVLVAYARRSGSRRPPSSDRSTSTPTTRSSGTSTSTGHGWPAGPSPTPTRRPPCRAARGAERVVTDGPFVELDRADRRLLRRRAARPRHRRSRPGGCCRRRTPSRSARSLSIEGYDSA